MMAWICLRIEKDFQKKFESDLGKNDSGEMLTIWGGRCLEMGLGGRLDWYPLQTLVHLRSKQIVVTDLYLEVYIQVDLSVQAYV